MATIIRAYMRASTHQQDAQRAKQELNVFARNKGVRIASFYTENVSGTTLERPELCRLIDESEAGDILLVEKVDRLTRLPYQQWETLKGKLKEQGILIVVVDQPTTHAALTGDENSGFIARALTDFMLDLAAGMARDDYETREKRQKQGIAKAKAEGKYKGRKANKDVHERILMLREQGNSYSQIQKLLGVSRPTISRAIKATQNAWTHQDS